MSTYYTDRQVELLHDFDADASRWSLILSERYGEEFTSLIIPASRTYFQSLIPQIPYIGGDDSWTGSLVELIRCLAFYFEMKKAGKSAEETGQILYDAIFTPQGKPQPPLPAIQLQTDAQLMERRRRRAAFSQERRYPEGFVCEFIPGDGIAFDYGFDFTECATQKFYHSQGADEFLSFFCRLDFAYSQLYGSGLTRTVTLAEGNTHCDHRFRREN